MLGDFTMTDIVTRTELEEAKVDCKDLGDALNTKKVINPRYGEPFYSLPLAVQKVMETGGFEPFLTQAQLLSSTPTISPKAAKALDTGKIWYWGKGEGETEDSWHDTGLSELDQAKQYFDLKLKNNALESLFDFNDSEQNTVARILSDGDIETAKFGKLSELPESTLDQAKQYIDFKTKSLDEDFSQSLFDFRDKDESIVAQLLENGDLNLAALDGKGVAQFIKLLLSVSADSSEDSSIFKLHDVEGDLVFDFTNDGDVIFGGGKSLKALTHKESNSVISIPSSYELLTDDFNSLISSYRNLSHVSSLPMPVGLCSQKFKISNKAEFLNLKISQSERIKIDTPYYQDDHVVHPFLCNFYKTFRGFKHLLLLTPYRDTRDYYENPCVYGSNDLINFELLSDMPQPLYERYPGSYNYNSDNFGVYDHTTGEFCVCWRNGATADGFSLWMSRTSDGINWTKREAIFPRSSELILSPNILFNPLLNKWVMYSISNDVIHESFDGNKFNYRLADSLYGPWSEPVFIDTPFTSWHQETRYCGNQYITIINDQRITGQLFLGVSEDGLSWEFSEVGMLEGEHLNTYKASIVPNVTEDSVHFEIFWTSSNVANGEDLWQLFHAKTHPIQIEGI
ncbi:hypothetical protein ABSDF2593 [Acinetobacter baumannii SDF]|uniref:Uncharacterized protein n=1 Tax=Acinetobacter baumannii (strain SDF) TaxID=509170 RepID=B0VTI6_ACIBS|nr:hypothetical protein ABSDF2593 [Acinetobacter baumannii SDF]